MQSIKTLLALLLLFFPLSACAILSAQTEDIQCGKDSRTFSQPAGCAAQCKGQIDAERCMLQPKLKELDDGFYKSYYNLSIFFGGNAQKTTTCGSKKIDGTIGTNTTMTLPGMILPGFGAMPTQLPGAAGHVAVRDKLVERIFGRWLHPWSYQDFNISWTTEKEGESAELVKTPDSCGRYSLIISVDSLCRSPADLIVVIGHEMVHREQYDRKYDKPGFVKLFPDDIGKIRADLREVEAYSWELRQGNFNWKFNSIGKNPLLPGMTKEETEEAQKAQKCYEWEAESKIAEFRGYPVAEQQMDSYFHQDDWVRTQWLPKHSNWKTDKPGTIPEPATCCPFLEARIPACKAYVDSYSPTTHQDTNKFGGSSSGPTPATRPCNK
jgi:hypothetical protein